MTAPTGDLNKRPLSRVALFALATALLTIVVLLMASLGFRLEWWSYRDSLTILRAGAAGGATAAVLSAIGIFMTWPGRGRRGLGISILSLFILGPALVTPLYWSYSKSKLPPIQDISTDLENPPDFWDAPTSRVYPGGDSVGQQLAAFPDVRPLVISRPLDELFRRAVALVHENGWELVAAELDEGRIEATVTTFWYGFKDDVVIRLREVDGAVRVDMRSASRFGSGGDGGSNANRIRAFLSALGKPAE